MTRAAIAIALSLLSAVPVCAGQTRDDFAYGFASEPQGDKPLWELSLPDEVYRTVTRADLGDLRVFNRDGLVVPHAVRRPATRAGDRPAPQRISVFPLRGRANERASGRRLRVTTNDRGEILSATTEDVSLGEAERVVAYLIDVGGLPQMPDRLDLEWEGGTERGFAVAVNVDAGDDLAHWRTVVSRVTLAELRSGGTALVHRDIDLPLLETKYLRIEWPDALRDVRLSGIEASFPPRQRPPMRRTTLVMGNPARDNSRAYEFDSRGVRPIDRVRVVFHERNAVLEAALLSRPTSDQRWRQRRLVTFYSLEHDGTQVQNAPAEIQSVSDRYWRLEIAGGQPWTGGPPALELGWVPDLLTVVAQGDGPFTVAFGSATVEAADRASNGLLNVINDKRGLIAAAQASGVFTLGGESRLEPPAPPLPWRTLVLWAVLVAGVGLLGWMVRQLARQMRAS
jgi:hypothetical protein